jgi:fructokinase
MVVGLGEVLWDMLPSGRYLGGAPANFAYCSHLLGSNAVLASRMGDDELGRELQEHLFGVGINTDCLQLDPAYPTGTVQVVISREGQPKFEITQPVAWDFLRWTDDWKSLAESADAVCFGSLAQRSLVSRTTILDFLNATRPDALRIFDVNLRQSFYSPEIISSSLQRASVLKLNQEELPVLASLLDLRSNDQFEFCRQVLQQFDLQLISITRGGNGSLLMDRNGTHEHPGFRVTIKDTVGAGDAFTAGLVHERLGGAPLPVMNDTANRMGAWVASRCGGMPRLPVGGIQLALASFSKT